MDVKKITNLLQGDDWFGHPVHPAIVMAPIGLWTFATAMDLWASVTKDECAQDVADMAVKGGLIGAGLAAITGLAEYLRVPLDERPQKDAITHGLGNAGIAALYGLNASMRSCSRKQRGSVGLLPKLLSLAGFGAIAYTGWLGGKLAYGHGVGVKLHHAMEHAQKTKEICEKQSMSHRQEEPVKEHHGLHK